MILVVCRLHRVHGDLVVISLLIVPATYKKLFMYQSYLATAVAFTLAAGAMFSNLIMRFFFPL